MSVNIYDSQNDELNQIAGREDTSYWEGTQAQWNALSSADKALWTGKYVIITDDEDSGVFTGATSSTNGTIGYVPAPTAGQQNATLMGNGSWSTALSDLQSRPFRYSKSIDANNNKFKIVYTSLYQTFFIVGAKGIMMSINGMNGATPQSSYLAMSGVSITVTAISNKSLTIDLNTSGQTNFYVFSDLNFELEQIV